MWECHCLHAYVRLQGNVKVPSLKCWNKMKNKKYNTMATIPKSSQNIGESEIPFNT